MKWLLQSAPYVDENYHSTFFLEDLDRLANGNPKEVAQIFIKMLESTVPTFKKDNIRSIVEKIYKAGLKAEANGICDRYARAGYPNLLRDLYEKYNQ